MKAEQKRAWLGVVTMVVCVVGYFVLLGLIGPVVAFAAFAFYGVNGFAGLIGRTESTDERDEQIVRRASRAGAVASYLAFVVACMGAWIIVFAFRGEEQVWVHVLPVITILAGVVFQFVRSVAVLALYGRHLEGENA